MEICNGKDIIVKVLEHIRANNEAFQLETEEGKRYYFMQEPFGTGKYIYSCCIPKQQQHKVPSTIAKKYELAAIYADSKLYVIDIFFLPKLENMLCGDVPTPEYVVFFNKVYQEHKKLAEQEYLPAFYETLEEPDPADVEKMMKETYVLQYIRKRLMYQQYDECDMYYIRAYSPIITVQDFVESLCGLCDLKDRAYAWFVETKEDHMIQKIKNQLFATPDKVMEPWALEMGKALVQFKAKTDVQFVAVEFTENHNGYTRQERVRIDKFIDCLADGSNCLGQYSFERDCPFLSVPCESIKRISYRKKTIYEKKTG